MQSLIIQFSKTPRPGHVKTRMQPALDAAACCRLHTALFTHVYNTLTLIGHDKHQLWADRNSAFFDGFVDAKPYWIQQGSSLGEKMYRAFVFALTQFPSVIIVGSDCPFISTSYLKLADAALLDNDVVIGPAADGGYVLLGCRQSSWLLFDGVEWSSDTVLNDTRKRLIQLQWRWEELPVLNDIDRYEDLRLLDSIDLKW